MAILLNDNSSDPKDQQVVKVLRAVQNRVTWSDRNEFAREISDARNAEFPNVFMGNKNEELLAQLKTRGIGNAPVEIDKGACENVLGYFSGLPCYNEHVPISSDGVARPIAETAKIANYGSYTLAQNITAPHILELALHPKLLDLAGGYLGCIPSIYSINTFWSFPSTRSGHTQTFHYDQDDFRFMTLFVYWTGIGKGEGEFYFVERTHDVHEVEKRIKDKRWLRLISRALRSVRNVEDLQRVTRKRRNKILPHLFPKEIVCITGSPGTAIVVDTFGIHRGSLPRTQARLCTWIRYGLYANWGYDLINTVPVPASLVCDRIPNDDITKFVTRLLLDWRPI